ncbi:MAG: hypothetical protein H6648_10930 [Caldilineae bacterium]|nr:hypothetical protein [Chloroflexota bacterium]MCB9177660.1 hypothetical protein [Caldilineae bacterium]
MGDPKRASAGRRIGLGLLLAAPLLVLALHADDHASRAQPAGLALLRWTLDGGGGRLEGGDYGLDGTLGQPDAGSRLSGGDFVLEGGFWPGIGAGDAALTPSATPVTPATPTDTPETPTRAPSPSATPATPASPTPTSGPSETPTPAPAWSPTPMPSASPTPTPATATPPAALYIPWLVVGRAPAPRPGATD